MNTRFYTNNRTFISLHPSILLDDFFHYSNRYSISVGQVFDEMGYAWNPCLHYSNIYLYFFLSFLFVSPSLISHPSSSVQCYFHISISSYRKTDLTDKMKCSFFQAAVVSILLYGCTTWTLTKRLEKKLDDNYTRMLRPILNKSWRQLPTKHQLYDHLPPITKTIQVRRTRYCWRSRDELIIDVLLWTPTYSRAKAERPARRYIQQLCEDTGCGHEDLPVAVNDREKWQERVRDIRACGTTWWW